jgi:hypothetical protein
MTEQTRTENQAQFLRLISNSPYALPLETRHTYFQQHFQTILTTDRVIKMSGRKAVEDWNRHIENIAIDGEPVTKLLGKSKFSSRSELSDFIKAHLLAGLPEDKKALVIKDVLFHLQEDGLMYAASTALRRGYTQPARGKTPIYGSKVDFYPTVSGFGLKETLTSSQVKDASGEIISFKEKASTVTHHGLFHFSSDKPVFKSISHEVNNHPDFDMLFREEPIGSKLLTIKSKGSIIPKFSSLGALISNWFSPESDMVDYGYTLRLHGELDKLRRELAKFIVNVVEKRKRNVLAFNTSGAIKKQDSDMNQLLIIFDDLLSKMNGLLVDEKSFKGKFKGSKVKESVALTKGLLVAYQAKSKIRHKGSLENLNDRIKLLEKLIKDIATWPMQNKHIINKRHLLELMDTHIGTLKKIAAAPYSDSFSKGVEKELTLLQARLEHNSLEIKAIYSTFEDAALKLERDYPLLRYLDARKQLAEAKFISLSQRDRLLSAVNSEDHLARFASFSIDSLKIDLKNAESSQAITIIEEKKSLLLEYLSKLKDELSHEPVLKDSVDLSHYEGVKDALTLQYEAYKLKLESLIKDTNAAVAPLLQEEQKIQEECLVIKESIENSEYQPHQLPSYEKINELVKEVRGASLDNLKQKVISSLTNYAHPRFFRNHHHIEEAKRLQIKLMKLGDHQSLRAAIAKEMESQGASDKDKAAEGSYFHLLENAMSI